jgi:hypothetical protein
MSALTHFADSGWTSPELAAVHELSVGGTSRPSAFATIRLTTRSNLVGCSTGRSAGFAPRKISSIKSPARR